MHDGEIFIKFDLSFNAHVCSKCVRICPERMWIAVRDGEIFVDYNLNLLYLMRVNEIAVCVLSPECMRIAVHNGKIIVNLTWI